MNSLILFLLIFSLILFLCLTYAISSTLRKKDYHNGKILNFSEAEKSSLNSDVKIMTFNIGFCGGLNGLVGPRLSKIIYQENFSTICETINQNDVDVLCVQEIDLDSKRSHYHNQVEAIAKNCNFPFVAVAYTWDKRWIPFPGLNLKNHFGKTLAGQAIFSKHPINKNDIYYFKKPNRNSFFYNLFYLDRIIQKVDITIHNKNITFVNVHLEAFDTKTLSNQINFILNKNHINTVISGDFNDELLLKKLKSNSSLQTNQINPILTYPSNSPNSQLDYILCSKDISIKEVKKIELTNFASDHHPLIATLDV